LTAGVLCLVVTAGAQPAVIGGPGAAGRAALGPLLPAQAQGGQDVEQSLGILHQRLAITAAQEGAFAGLAAVMRENARMAPGGPPANADAVEQLRLAIQYGQQYIAGLRRLLPALQTLYATLSPAQRGVADQLFRQGPGR
jgi:hypothetical protein